MKTNTLTFYRSALLLFACCWLGLSAFGQTLRGTVRALDTRQPLAGASISLAGTDQGTLTDEQGTFSLPYQQAAPSLTIKYIGYAPLTFTPKTPTERLDIQLRPAELELDQVMVTAFENNRSLLETAGAISKLDERTINNFNNLSLGQAFNTLPGVRYEENNYGGGARLLIRGTQLRAEYSTRNVKFYWNDIPLTDPTGETPLQFIDASTVGAIEVIRGPAGSIYGPGNGGVVIMRSKKADFNQRSLGVSQTVGSFGMRRTLVQGNYGSDKLNLVATYINQQNDGFRDNGAVDKEVLTLMGQAYTGDNGLLSFNFNYYDGGYGLPGTLNREEFEADPSQARPGSAAFDARVNYRATTVGLSYRSDLMANWEQVTSIFLKTSTLDHPFGFAGAETFGGNTYNLSPADEIGGRTRLTGSYKLAGLPFRLSLGGEYQRRINYRQVYFNEFGVQGAMRENTEIRSTQYLGFAQAELDLPADFFLTLGASANAIDYDIRDRFTATEDPANNSAAFSYDPVVAPRISLVKKLTPSSSLHGSVSYGYSPPVAIEVNTNAGINTDLQAEYAWNYEIGYRATFADRLNVDVTSYYFQLQNAILPIVTSSSHSAFENRGSTNQFGVEAALSYLLRRDPTATFSLVKPWLSYTYNHFRFDDYRKEGFGGNGEVVTNDFSGNILTGTAPHSVSAGIDAEMRCGLFANLMFNFVDRRPVTDANDLFFDAYSVLNAKVGYRRNLGRKLAMELFAGGGNLMDASYVSFPALNGFGGRYWNPAPGRNFFGGASLRYHFR